MGEGMTTDKIREVVEALRLAPGSGDPLWKLVTPADLGQAILYLRAYADLLDSDALIIRRDENGEWPEAVVTRIAFALAGVQLRRGIVPGDKRVAVAVLDALASSQGVEPVSDRADTRLLSIVEKATPYGEQDGGFVAYYLIPTGPIHRAILYLQQHGYQVPLPPSDDDWEHCDDCGRAYSDVYWLDDDLWAVLHDDAPGGLLCPSCAVNRALDITVLR